MSTQSLQAPVKGTGTTVASLGLSSKVRIAEESEGGEESHNFSSSFSVFRSNGGTPKNLTKQVLLVDPDWVSPAARSYNLKDIRSQISTKGESSLHKALHENAPSQASQYEISTACPSELDSRPSTSDSPVKYMSSDDYQPEGDVSQSVIDLSHAHDPSELACCQENKCLAEKWRDKMATEDTKQRFLTMLKKLKMFKQSTPSFLEAVAMKLTPIVYHEGQILMAQGDIEDWMLICLSGTANILVHFKNQGHGSIKVGELKPGAFLGELAALGISLRRTATVVAQEECTALVLSRSALQEALDDAPDEQNTFRFVLDYPLHLDQQTLSTNKYFKDLDPAFVAEIQKQLELRLFVTGEKIMREGDYGDQMFILQHGVVSVERNGIVVVQLEDGAMLGEMAVLGSDKRRSATVVCKSWCVFQVLRGEVFGSLLEQFPGDQQKFDHHFITRLVAIDLPKVTKELQGFNDFYGAVHPNPNRGDAVDSSSNKKSITLPQVDPPKSQQQPHASPSGSSSRTLRGNRARAARGSMQSSMPTPQIAGILSTVSVDHDVDH